VALASLNRERHGMKYHQYSKEEIAYIKRLYGEGVNYEEIKKRFAAEFGYEKLSNGVIWRHGGRNKKQKRRVVKVRGPLRPMERDLCKPTYCMYCGNKLKRW
jgi:intein-encoded DNA endonuclease-like protein